PLAVAIFGSRRLLDLLWVALAGGGVVLLAFGHPGGSAHSLNPAGILLALLAGTFWAGYILFSQRVGSTFTGLQGLAIALSVAAVALLPAGLIPGGRLRPADEPGTGSRRPGGLLAARPATAAADGRGAGDGGGSQRRHQPAGRPDGSRATARGTAPAR